MPESLEGFAAEYYY